MSTPAPLETGESTAGNVLEGDTRFRLPQATSGQFAFEEPAEAAHNRQMALDKAAHERRKELDEIRRQTLGQAIAMIIVVAIAVGCLWVIVSNKYPPTTVDKASAALLLILGGFIGFITGQATKR